jgi:hypothetical protein
LAIHLFALAASQEFLESRQNASALVAEQYGQCILRTARLVTKGGEQCGVALAAERPNVYSSQQQEISRS